MCGLVTVGIKCSATFDGVQFNVMSLCGQFWVFLGLRSGDTFAIFPDVGKCVVLVAVVYVCEGLHFFWWSLFKK